jgi:hypothetical protein
MRLSPAYRAQRLRDIQHVLQTARYDLAKILETAACAEIHGLDETILLIEDLRHRAPAPSLGPVAIEGDPW